jgi:hypothetical protein
MDIMKFLSVLIDKTLYFPSGKTLIAEFDRYEGQPTYAEVATMSAPPNPASDIYLDLSSFQELTITGQKNQMKTIENQCFFNCWHLNLGESDAMWKIYRNGCGVAIQSTLARFRKALNATDKEIYIGKIRYYTEPDDNPPDTPTYVWRFMRKRKAFEHEHELRAVFTDSAQSGEHGVSIPIYVDELVSKVIISPYAEPWSEALIKSLAWRLGFKFEVVVSEAAAPLPSTLLP